MKKLITFTGIVAAGVIFLNKKENWIPLNFLWGKIEHDGKLTSDQQLEEGYFLGKAPYQ